MCIPSFIACMQVCLRVCVQIKSLDYGDLFIYVHLNLSEYSSYAFCFSGVSYIFRTRQCSIRRYPSDSSQLSPIVWVILFVCCMHLETSFTPIYTQKSGLNCLPTCYCPLPLVEDELFFPPVHRPSVVTHCILCCCMLFQMYFSCPLSCTHPGTLPRFMESR